MILEARRIVSDAFRVSRSVVGRPAVISFDFHSCSTLNALEIITDRCCVGDEVKQTGRSQAKLWSAAEEDGSQIQRAFTSWGNEIAVFLDGQLQCF